jgi:hypothetical protein
MYWSSLETVYKIQKMNYRSVFLATTSCLIARHLEVKSRDCKQRMRCPSRDNEFLAEIVINANCVFMKFIGILRNPDRTRTRTLRKPGLEKNPDPDSKKIRTRV